MAKYWANNRCIWSHCLQDQARAGSVHAQLVCLLSVTNFRWKKRKFWISWFSLSLSLSLSPTHTHTLSFSLSGCRLPYHRPTHTLVFSTSVYNVFMPRIGSPWNKVLGNLSPPTCRFSCYNWILSSLNINENGWNYSQEVYFEKERILAFLWFQFMKVLSS